MIELIFGTSLLRSPPFFLVTLKINFNNRLKITIKSHDTRCIYSFTIHQSASSMKNTRSFSVRTFHEQHHTLFPAIKCSVAALNLRDAKKRKEKLERRINSWLASEQWPANSKQRAVKDINYRLDSNEDDFGSFC